MVIFLEIPNKLVLEVEGKGSYESIEWSKAGEAICPLNDSNNKYNLAIFDQVLYRSVTNNADYGQYRAEYRGLFNRVDFLVLNPGKVSITHTYIHTYIYTYIHMYTHTYITHTYIYIYICRDNRHYSKK